MASFVRAAALLPQGALANRLARRLLACPKGRACADALVTGDSACSANLNLLENVRAVLRTHTRQHLAYTVLPFVTKPERRVPAVP
jgi:hypothetical protein